VHDEKIVGANAEGANDVRVFQNAAPKNQFHLRRNLADSLGHGIPALANRRRDGKIELHGITVDWPERDCLHSNATFWTGHVSFAHEFLVDGSSER
jgi:hypothetical protein